MIEHFDACKIKCDRCGEYFEFDGYENWFRDEEDAVERVFDFNWTEINGKHYCPNCYEYNEETDEDEVKEMTIEQLKEAQKNGATIQFNLDGEWLDWENPTFDCPQEYYRIKPKWHDLRKNPEV